MEPLDQSLFQREKTSPRLPNLVAGSALVVVAAAAVVTALYLSAPSRSTAYAAPATQAAAAAGSSVVDRAADRVFWLLCPIFGTCPKETGSTVAQHQPAGLPQLRQPVAVVPAGASGTTTVIQQTVQQTVQPIRERVIERIVQQPAPQPLALSESSELLEARLRGFEQQLRSQLSQGSAAASYMPVASFAPSQRIDNLSNTTIQNPTITGGTISGTSITGDISANNATISGSITAATSTVSALSISGTECSSFGGGGKLTTDAFGFVVCSDDVGAIATSSLNHWLSLKTTDDVPQGSEHKYYTSGLFAADLAATSTDAVREGSTNRYYTDDRVASLLQAGSGINLTYDHAGSLTISSFGGGGAGTDINWAYISNGLIRPATSSNIVLVGMTSTSSSARLQVSGGATFDTATTSNLAVTGVSSSLLKADASGKVVSAVAGTDYLNSTSGDWTGTLGGYSASQLIAAGFSTTSVNFWKSQSDLFSTTSVNSWLATKSTSNLVEGSNLYYTDARADARINATSSIGTLAAAPILGTVSTGLTGFLKATAGVLSTALVDLASNVTGTLGISHGGTGWSNLASGAVLLGNGTGALSTTTRGSLTETGSSVLTITGGSNALLGSGATIQVQQANGSQSGYLSSADWSTFNGKQASLGSLTGLVGGNIGTYYAISTSSLDASITGNAGTATRLAAARQINGVAFDGSTDITITSASSTLLSNSNTFSGLNTFSQAPIFSSLSGLLKGNGSGALTTAVAGTDYATPAQLSASFPFIGANYGVSTSTTVGFANGLLSLASSTFTGSTHLPGGIWSSSGSVGIGTTDPVSKLEIADVARDPSLSYTTSETAKFRGLYSGISMGATTNPTQTTWLQSKNIFDAASPFTINPLGGWVGINTLTPTTALQVNTNWCDSTYWPNCYAPATAAVYAEGNAISGWARSKNAGGGSAIGVTGFGFGDRVSDSGGGVSGAGGGWGGYFEGHRMTNNEYALGVEIAVINRDSSVIGLTPYGMVGSSTGQVVGQQIDCGNGFNSSELTYYGCTVGLHITKNTSGAQPPGAGEFDTGINIAAGALSSAHTPQRAMTLPKDAGIVWFAPSGNQSWSLYSDATAGTNSLRLGNDTAYLTSNLNVSGSATLGTAGGDVVIGDVGSPSDLVFEENSTIRGQGTGRSLTFGANNDIVNFGVNVGIGTTNPGTKLEVAGSNATIRVTDGVHAFEGGSYNGAGILSLRNTDWSTLIQLRADGAPTYFNGGNVGIGTTEPSALLTLNGGNAASTSLALMRGSTQQSIPTAWAAADEARISFYQNDNSGGSGFTRSLDIVSNGSGGWSDGILRLMTNAGGSTPLERMRITGAGNVGIGTTNPGTKLEVAGSNATIRVSDGVYAFEGGSYNGAGILSLRNTDWSTPIQLRADGAPTYFNGGNVGIGTLNPAAKLDVISSGIFTSGQFDRSQRLLVNGIDTDATYHTWWDNGYSTDALTVGIKNNASTTNQVNAISGYLEAATSTSGGVAGFFVANAKANNANIFGINPVTIVEPTSSSSTVQNEFDFNIQGPNAVVSGANLQMIAGQKPAGAIGWSVHSGAGEYHWNGAFYSDYGAATDYGLFLGPVGVNGYKWKDTPNAQQSQEIWLVGRNSAGTALMSKVFSTADGTLILKSGQNNAPFVFQDPAAGNVLYASPSTGYYLGSSFGIGTTNPGSLLTVAGSAAKPGGGSWSDSSDARLKTAVAPIDSADALTKLLALKPVTFDWRNPSLHGNATSSGGFLAQDIAQVFPDFVSTTSCQDADCALVGGASSSPAYSLTLPFKFFGYLVAAIQEVAKRVNSFADRFTTRELAFVRAEGDYVGAKEVTAHNRLCVGSTCITESQLAAVLAAVGQGGSSPYGGTGQPNGSHSPATPPAISIIGANPAQVYVGDTYSDNGATITGPTDADKNLGLSLFLDGVAVPSIILDTATPGTHTIDYVAANAAGTATSTRTVFVEVTQI